MEALQQYIDKAAVLVQALPYIQFFRGKVVVVKYGGSTMADAADDTVLADIVFMESVGIKPVIVHGGGPAIDRRLEEAGIETKRVNGLRVTDEATMKVVEQTLFGEVNASIVEEIARLGGRARGLSPKDAGIMHVRKHLAKMADGSEVDIGYVGAVERIDAAPITALINEGTIPVLAPIGRGPGDRAYNVNADTAAGEVAAALHAEKLVFLTDVQGILEDPADVDSLLSTVHVEGAESLIAAGIVSGGMIPKVRAGVHSVKAGVGKTHIIDGRISHSMLLEFFTDEGVGTQIVQ